MALMAISVGISSCGNQAKQQENEKQLQQDGIRVEAAVQNNHESRTWTGASSVSELRQKLDGTSWYINEKGLKRKFAFSNGSVTMYTSMDGNFDENDGHYYNSYEAKSQGQFFVVFFGGSEKHMEYRSFSIGFAQDKAILFQFDKPIGELTFMGR